MVTTRQTAVVTGAARPWGLGRQVALGLAHKGFDIAVVDVRDDWGNEAAETIAKETGRRSIFVKTDLMQALDITAMARRVVQDLGGIDVLVNVAAIIFHENVEVMSDAALERTMKVNFEGAARCCQAVIVPMRERGGGRIVNVASGAARLPIRGLALYSASKAALVAFSQVLAKEVAQDGIDVSIVAPGPMSTAMGAEGGPSEEEVGAPRRGLPFGRALLPAEVADVIIYLATSPHHALAGQTLHANGASFIV